MTILDEIGSALKLFDAPSAMALFFLGLVVGRKILGRIPAFQQVTPSTVATMLTFIGSAYFVFLVFVRVFSQSPLTAERTVGTWLLWLVYCAGAYVGAHLRLARR